MRFFPHRSYFWCFLGPHDNFAQQSYVANRLPARNFLRCQRRWKAPGSTRFGLQTVEMQSFTSPFCRMGPSDFHFIVSLMKHLDDKQFATDANVKQALPSCLQNTLHWFLIHWDTSPGFMVDKCLNISGWLRGGLTCAMYASSQNKFQASRVLVTLFPCT